MQQTCGLLRGFLFLTALTLAAPAAWPGQISINFDDAALTGDNYDPLLQFYDGGTTYLGKGPGPALGVTFSLNASELTNTSNFAGTFSSPGVALLYNANSAAGAPLSFTMDVNGGFMDAVYFDYSALTDSTLDIYSGPDGGGSLLDELALPATSATSGIFVSDSVTFSGIGNSIVFSGGNNQLAVDDIVLTSAAPEPSSICLLGAAILCGLLCRRLLQRRDGSVAVTLSRLA